MKILPLGQLPEGQLRSDPLLWAMPDSPERELLMRRAWARHTVSANYAIWSRHIPTENRYINVAMAASITGAARADLMFGISKSTRPIYCDTDSILCEELALETSSSELGKWKHELTATRAAIAGKKLYALFNDNECDEKTLKKRKNDYDDGTCVKIASKGVRLMAPHITSIASDHALTCLAVAPTMKLDGRQVYTNRQIRRTA